MRDWIKPEALKAFGKVIRELRKNLNLTQERLAEMCDRHPVFISELERGHRSPSLDTILRLSRALKVSPAELMELAFPSDPKQSELKKQIIALVVQQDADNLKKLLALIKAYLEA